MDARKLITALLLGFVIFSVCFGLARQTALLLRKQPEASQAASAQTLPNRVIIYYAHPTIRCATCGKIQAMTQELVHSQFAQQLHSGQLQWQEADFQQEEALARRYDISASTVVVAAIRDGKEIGFQRLDEVWTLVDKPDQFRSYVAAAIRAHLPEGQ